LQEFLVEHMSAFDLFTKLPLFDCLSQEDLMQLIPKIALDFEDVPNGHILYKTGTACKRVVYLLKGRVSLRSGSTDRTVHAPALLVHAELFRTGKKHAFTAQAQEDSSLMYVDEVSFMFMLRNHSTFLNQYLHKMIHLLPEHTTTVLTKTNK